MPAWFVVVIAAVAALAGTIASVVSAGVDSLLTPAFSLHMDMRTAVLAAATPHLVFNVLRCWTMRSRIHGPLFRRFGLTSAAGSLGGSLAHQAVSSEWITGAFAALLIVTGLFGITGAADRVRFGTRGAYAGGVLSGFFGGLTGEQGGLRAAALLGFRCSKEAFVATATAAAVVVDLIRIPVYVASRGVKSRRWPFRRWSQPPPSSPAHSWASACFARSPRTSSAAWSRQRFSSSARS
jgi:hypothetical protein